MEENDLVIEISPENVANIDPYSISYIALNDGRIIVVNLNLNNNIPQSQNISNIKFSNFSLNPTNQNNEKNIYKNSKKLIKQRNNNFINDPSNNDEEYNVYISKHSKSCDNASYHSTNETKNIYKNIPNKNNNQLKNNSLFIQGQSMHIDQSNLAKNKNNNTYNNVIANNTEKINDNNTNNDQSKKNNIAIVKVKAFVPVSNNFIQQNENNSNYNSLTEQNDNCSQNLDNENKQKSKTFKNFQPENQAFFNYKNSYNNNNDSNYYDNSDDRNCNTSTNNDVNYNKNSENNYETFNNNYNTYNKSNDKH